MQKKSLALIVTVLIWGAAFGVVFASSRRAWARSVMRPAAPLSAEATSLPLTPSGFVVARLYYNNQAHLDAVAGALDIWEVHRQEQFVVAALTSAQFDWLKLLGYRIEIDLERTTRLLLAPLDPRYAYFDDYFPNPNGNYVVDFLQTISNTYPTLTELIDIGDAWLAGQPGEHDREMWVLRVTNEDPAFGPVSAKPAFFLMAEIHAREVATPELAMRYIRFLTEGYNGQGGYDVDPDVTWLINHNVAYVLVMQNPDGHWPNEVDWSEYRRKNMNDSACGSGNFGVDLNRNHSFLWGCCGGSSSDPCDETYRGVSEASEPETQAFQDYIVTVIPDQNGPNGNDQVPLASPITTTGVFISLHSYSDDILWPWYLPGIPNPPNFAQLEDIGRKFADINGYNPAGTIGYTVDGSANYWTYGKLGIPAYTFEVGPASGACGGFFPDYGCVDGTGGMPRSFWGENRPVFVYAHKIARTPYLTAYGSDTENVVVTPAIVDLGMPVTLTALVADHRYPGDPLLPVAAAEYFVDYPGADGTGAPLLPGDGAWGETSEDVYVTLDTLHLTPGKHYILVHGMNNQGVWGPFTAVFLEVTLPAYNLRLRPAEASALAEAGSPVTYTLTLFNVGAQTDTYTLTIDSNWPTAISTLPGPLPSLIGAPVTVTVTIPLTATDGLPNTALFTATSWGDNARSATSNLSTRAYRRGLSVSPAASVVSGDPGEIVTHTLQITNTGELTDTIQVSLSGVDWDTAAPLTTGSLAAAASANLVVTVTIPITASDGEGDTAALVLTSQHPGVQPVTASLTTNANAVYGFLLVTESLTQTAHLPGVTLTYTLHLTNTGNASDVFNIEFTGGWPVGVSTPEGPLSPGDDIDLSSDQHTLITVTVTVPGNAQPGMTDLVTIEITSLGEASLSQVMILATKTDWYAIYLPVLMK
jgi:hypothetical protein